MSNLPVRQAVLFALCLFASPALAQQGLPYAMRAPLDIIPQPMRQAVGESQQNQANAETKLAPRVAAQQMTRAVRAVAALPGSETQIVQVGQLGALEDAPIGLEPGYGGALWRGARLAFVGDLMARLPKRHELSAMRELERGLHRSATAAPKGSARGVSWTVARLNRFLAIGDTQSALDLAELTGIAARDTMALKAQILALIGQGNDAAACEQATPERGAANRLATRGFFLQLIIYCHLRDGDEAKAALAIELNEKTLAEDPLFRELAFLMASKAPIRVISQTQLKAQKAAALNQPAENTTPPKPSESASAEPDAASAPEPLVLPAELTALQIALLRLAGQAIPMEDNIVPAYLLAAVANDRQQSAFVRAQAAIQNLAYEGAADGQLLTLSQRVDFSPHLPRSLPYRADDLDPALFIAMSVQQIDKTAFDARPNVMAYFLRQAMARNIWQQMALALSQPLKEISVARPIDAETQAVLLPALVLVGADEAANRLYWLNSAAMTPLSQRLFALSQSDFILPNLAQTQSVASLDLSTIEPAGQFIDWAAMAGEMNNAAAPIQDYLRTEISILRGLGFETPSPIAEDFLVAEPSARAQRWLTLAEDQWIGDLILSITSDMAALPALQWRDDDIVAVLMALRQAGLSQQALALGRELLSVNYAQLVAANSAALIINVPVESQIDEPGFSLPTQLQDETIDALNRDYEWSDNLPLIDFNRLEE